MKIKSIELIKILEQQLETNYSLRIFKGYVAINKRGVEKIIDELYANLPEDVANARKYLRNNHPSFLPNEVEKMSKSNIYDNLSELETMLDNTIGFATYVIVNIREIEKLIDKIYNSLPDEIKKAERFDKQ